MAMFFAIFSFILFFILSFIFFYPAGNLALGLAKFNLSKTEKTLASIPIGIALFILINFFFSYFQIPFLGLLFFGGIIFYSVIFNREILKIDFLNLDIVSLLIIVLGTIAFSSLTFFSGLITGRGMNFINVNATDGMVHLALMQSLINHVPAQLPSLNGFNLRGYHYFYDFFASRFILFFNFSPLDLQFRLLPVLMSFLYGVAIYLFTIKESNVIKRLALLFSYFGQNFIFIWALINKSPLVFLSADIPQPLQLIYDPSIILSLGILFVAFFLLMKGENLKQGILVGLLLGIMSEIKVYAGIIGILVLVFYALIFFLKEKGKRLFYFSSIFITAIITTVTFLPNNFGTAQFIFLPFVIYYHFIEGGIFNAFKWGLLLQVYETHHSFLRIIQLYLEAFLFFWIITLGLRIIAVLGLYKILKRDFWQENIEVLLLLAVLFSVLIPTFFIQSVSVFDINQFIWIGLIFWGILTSIVIGYFFKKINFIFKIILSLLIVGFFIPGFIYTEQANFSQNIARNFSFKDLKVIKEIRKNTTKNNFLIVIPKADIKNKTVITIDNLDFDRGPTVSGLTGRNTFYEKSIVKYGFLEKEYLSRKEKIFFLTNDLLSCNMVKVENDLKNIGSFNLVSFNDFSCANSNLDVIKTYSGDNIFYYKFKTIE